MRAEGRQNNRLRTVEIHRHYTTATSGSVLVQAGKTRVLCTASIDETVPPWKMGQENAGGWVTAEYSMLPGSTSPRKSRERGKIDGRSSEIQRLIGRSLRAIVDMEGLGPRTIVVDCDVLEADGGTRTLSVTGGFIALADALAAIRPQLSVNRPVLRNSVAAVSVGIVGGRVLLDLDYNEDSKAEVDLNVVMTGSGEFIEVQGTAEGRTFGRKLLSEQLDLAQEGIRQLTDIQRSALGAEWPL